MCESSFGTMKALAKLKPETGIWITNDNDVPEIGASDVLIKVKKSAICGTDIHIYKWDGWAQNNVPVPLITGHEYVGVIEAVGKDVHHLKKGQRVTSEGHLVCGVCRSCRAGDMHLCPKTRGVGYHIQGSFAEYFAVPASNVIPIPDDISDDLAAIFDPLGNAVNTALEFDLVGEDVVITGAGPIGMMAAAICRHAGARHVVVTDVNDYRLELAAELGATYTMNATKETLKDVMDKLGMKEGFDVGLEMSGVESAFNGMISSMRSSGKIALLGIPPGGEMNIDWNKVIFKGLTIKGIYGRRMYETWYKMIAMLQSGLDVSKVITHRFDIDDFQKGFDAMLSGQSGKVILEW